MHTYTSCQTCGTQLEVAPTHGPHTHTCPTCPPVGIHADAVEYEQLASRAHLTGPQKHRLDALAQHLDNYDHRPADHLAAALAYAQWGWRVFPCLAGSKAPWTRHGLHDATTDPEHITGWWTRRPHANIGLRTGDHFDVLDIDPDGLAWYMRARINDTLPGDIHGIVHTPRGAHLYIAPSGAGNLARIHPGVDYRGSRGYVIAPPSTVDGIRYLWSIYPSPVIKSTAADVTP